MRSFSETFQNKSKLISRRMFILTSIKIGVFVSIISRLFYLQISENIKYRSLSDKNRFREWKMVPERGIIEDYYGNKIADNIQTFQLHMVPEDVPNMEELFFRLSRIINFTETRKRMLIKRLKKRKRWEPIVISDNLTWQEFSKVNLFLHEIQGIKPVVALSRKYSEDGATSHLVGYVSDTFHYVCFVLLLISGQFPDMFRIYFRYFLFHWFPIYKLFFRFCFKDIYKTL